jgi:hypothetical protein
MRLDYSGRVLVIFFLMRTVRLVSELPEAFYAFFTTKKTGIDGEVYIFLTV